MSPDPPREDSQDPSLNSGPGRYDVVVVLDDDMMGEGDHELDFSSQPESDFSEDDDDDNDHYRGNGTEDAVNDGDENSGNEEGHSVRGRYQLLIPFQIETLDDDRAGSEDEELIDPPVVEVQVQGNTAPISYQTTENDSDTNAAPSQVIQ